MAKYKRKADKKLAERIEAYEQIPIQFRRAHTRPGSQNPHKQGAGAVKRMGRR